MNEKQSLDGLVEVHIRMDVSPPLNHQDFESEQFVGKVEAKKILTPEAFKFLEPFLNKGLGNIGKRKIEGYRIVILYNLSIEEYLNEIHIHELIEEDKKKRMQDFRYNSRHKPDFCDYFGSL